MTKCIYCKVTPLHPPSYPPSITISSHIYPNFVTKCKFQKVFFHAETLINIEFKNKL